MKYGYNHLIIELQLYFKATAIGNKPVANETLDELHHIIGYHFPQKDHTAIWAMVNRMRKLGEDLAILIENRREVD